jgi:hypothetical protein
MTAVELLHHHVQLQNSHAEQCRVQHADVMNSHALELLHHHVDVMNSHAPELLHHVELQDACVAEVFQLVSHEISW